MIGGMTSVAIDEAELFEDIVALFKVVEQMTEPGIDTIKTPDRYIEVRRCKDDLVRRRKALADAVGLLDTVLGRVQGALTVYEDTDPHKIINDMLDARRH